MYTQYDLPFVEVYRAREFTFRAQSTLQSENELTATRASSQLSVWNCDGEVIDNADVKIRSDEQGVATVTLSMRVPGVPASAP